MRFHVVGLASTQTTIEYLTCAYTQKARNFCKMMMDRGHEVFLYSGEQNDAPCTQHFECISEGARAAGCGNGHFHNADHTPDAPHWMEFNTRAIAHMRALARKGDFLCIIFGMAQKPIADAMQHVLLPVEYGVGYHYTFASHRVFESYAWMHTVYGSENKPYTAGGAGSDRNGVFFDEVINGYIDPSQFELGTKSDYLLYLGRMIERKGVLEAVEIAQATGRRLIGAGPGTAPKGMQHVGEVGWAMRRDLLSQAHAVLMPTKYIEPFGNVAIEAMASGTPVISTDWGAFTETVIPGVTGYRCRSLQQYVDAVAMCGPEFMRPEDIRRHALWNYSMDVIGHKYERYFERLSTLWGGGYYQLREGVQC